MSSRMICGYCNGSGEEHDPVRGSTSECLECMGTGKAICNSCGDHAEFVDDDGDYTCGDCWQDALMDEEE